MRSPAPPVGRRTHRARWRRHGRAAWGPPARPGPPGAGARSDALQARLEHHHDDDRHDHEAEERADHPRLLAPGLQLGHLGRRTARPAAATWGRAAYEL